MKTTLMFSSLPLLLVGATATAAPPGGVFLRSPAYEDVLNSNSITFTWRAADDASGYRLFVTGDHGTVIEEYLSAEQTHCANVQQPALPDSNNIVATLPVTCSYTVSRGFIPGAASWSVTAYNADGYGPAATSSTFYVHDQRGAWNVKLPSGVRFVPVFGGVGVLDRETGLVWEQAPSDFDHSYWSDASRTCQNLVIGQIGGWRLPSAEEMGALMAGDPAYAQHFELPEIEPWSSPQVRFWTATPASNRSGRYVAYLSDWFYILQLTVLNQQLYNSAQFQGHSEFYRVERGGQFGFSVYAGIPATGETRAWCVRGGKIDNAL